MKKQGVDYFPLDVHMDDKIKLIQIKFGLEGFACIIKLYQKIFSNGYYCEWGEDHALIFADENRIDIKKVNQIIEETLTRGIFNNDLYQSYNILTSNGIQKRFAEITKRRKEVIIITEYILNDNMLLTSCIHDVSKNEQRKGKERKGKESKGKDIKDTKVSMSDKSDVPYQKIVEVYNAKCISLNPVKQISDKRKSTIRARYKEHGLDTILEMINKASQSIFLAGQNNRDWTATFDWLFKPNNFIKVLEGNYDNKSSPAKSNIKKNNCHNFQQRKYDAEELEKLARTKFENFLKEGEG